MDLFTDTYRIIESPVEGLFKDRGSKFIAKIYPIENEHDIKEVLENLRSEYYDARHHCYAYILGPDKSNWRANDDGEPSGSAGKPIYGQLLSYDLTNILAVVIRYFGGTKLGIPGLINAYREAVKDALSQATILEKTVNETFLLKFDYPVMDLVMRTIKEKNYSIISTKFEMSCEIRIEVRKAESTEAFEYFKGIYGVEIVGE